MVNNFLFEVSILNNGKQVKTKAFLDSGNRLKNGNGKGVVVINYSVFNKLFLGVSLTDILLGKLNNLPLKNCEYINTSSIAGNKSKMLVFDVEQININLENEQKKLNNITLGLTLNKFQDSLNYNVLLSPALFQL